MFSTKVPWSQSANIFLLALTCILLVASGVNADPDIGKGSYGGERSHLDVDDPDFSGVVDFSNAIPGPDGSWCITKMKYVDHMVKDQVKECWHENVTQCHDTYVTEFLPSQEQKCEETFWKSCKIDFKEAPYNYSMKQCHAPLVKECGAPAYNAPTKDSDIVCKTWFESECNTTFVVTSPNKEDLPNTWCKKVPRKICAPDNCKMVPGPEQCNQKMMVSTIQKPSEVCDLQPQTHCRLVTRLVPHLIQKEVCRNVPKEMCHLTLGNPHTVKKPMRLRWCTKHKPKQASVPLYKPPSKPSYLPPPPTRGSIPTSLRPAGPTTTYRPNFEQGPPVFSSPTGRPSIQFQRRSQNPIFETKFKPKIPIQAERLASDNSQNILIEDFFVQNSEEDLELITKTHHAQSLTQPNPVQSERTQNIEFTKEFLENPEVVKPSTLHQEEKSSDYIPKSSDVKLKLSEKLPKKSVNIPPVLPASISDDLTGFGSYGSFGYSNDGESFL